VTMGLVAVGGMFGVLRCARGEFGFCQASLPMRCGVSAFVQ
jgi:hypothetical protein